MKKIVIDGEGLIFGRICSFAAKNALEGNEVIIFNSGKVIITGSKKDIIYKYDRLKKKGGFSQKGPRISRASDKILKRTIRGMLPDFRRGQGKEAFKRIKCYQDLPKNMGNEKIISINMPKKLKFIELKELSDRI
ncbi:MAG: 50S ribosomal protein L13 [Nanoarchaeota archaeon]